MNFSSPAIVSWSALSRRLAPAVEAFGRSSWARSALFGLFVTLTFPALVPQCSQQGVDPSWKMALNDVARGDLAYGQDFVFTYGPLGFVWYPQDTGSNVYHALVFQLFIYALWWLSVWLLARDCQGSGLFAALLAVAAFSGVGQSLGLVLLVAMLTWLSVGWRRDSLTPAIPAVVLAAIAMLTKFNIGVVGLGVVVLYATCVMWRRRDRWSALGMAGLAGIYLCCFLTLFAIYGGPVSAIPEFLRLSGLLASGYSAQVSRWGYPWQVGTALLQAGILAGLFWKAYRTDRKAAVIAVLAGFALVGMFKSGFVRQSIIHTTFYYFTVPALACLAAPSCVGPLEKSWLRTALLLLAISFGSRLAERPKYVVLFPPGMAHLADAVRWRHSLALVRQETKDAAAEQELPAAVRAKIGRQPIDVYPHDASWALANDLCWSPRLVCQSYAAYWPELDRRNADHYLGDHAPAFVLYSPRTIDHAHPLIVDPQTWIELYRWYDFDEPLPKLCSRSNEPAPFLLRRREAPRFGEPTLRERAAAHFNQRIEVPGAVGRPLLLAADFELTLLGRWLESAFKVLPPRIAIDYEDGSTREFTICWRNCAGGFLVSDLPSETDEHAALWQTGHACPVRAVRFLGNTLWFRDRIELRWLELPEAADQRLTRSP